MSKVVYLAGKQKDDGTVPWSTILKVQLESLGVEVTKDVEAADYVIANLVDIVDGVEVCSLIYQVGATVISIVEKGVGSHLIQDSSYRVVHSIEEILLLSEFQPEEPTRKGLYLCGLTTEDERLLLDAVRTTHRRVVEDEADYKVFDISQGTVNQVLDRVDAAIGTPDRVRCILLTNRERGFGGLDNFYEVTGSLSSNLDNVLELLDVEVEE